MKFRSDSVHWLIDTANDLTVAAVQLGAPIDVRAIYDSIRPMIPEPVDLSPAVIDGIVFDVVRGIAENAILAGYAPRQIFRLN